MPSLVFKTLRKLNILDPIKVLGVGTDLLIDLYVNMHMSVKFGAVILMFWSIY